MTAIFAHRGCHFPGGPRENTLEAFAAARGAGAGGVELDVRLTADAELVVHHDRRIPGAGDVTNMTSSDLPPYVPLLADALTASQGMQVNVEVKHGGDGRSRWGRWGRVGPAGRRDERVERDEGLGVAEAVAALLSGRPGPGPSPVPGTGAVPGQHVLVSSFDGASLERVRALDPAIPLGLLIDRRTPAAVGVRRAQELGCATLHPFVAQVTPDLIDRAGEAGLGLHVWTVNAPADIAAMLSLGVAAIITDRVGAAVELARATRNGDDAAG
jgi:glycerophosphoryl diester phosphodiesterase